MVKNSSVKKACRGIHLGIHLRLEVFTSVFSDEAKDRF